MVAPAALALLAVASAEPRLAVDLRLAAPFAVGAEDAPAPPDLATTPPPAPAPRVRTAAVVRAAAGIALADVLSLALMLPAFTSSCFLESCSPPGWVAPLLVAGVVSYLFLPPAMGVGFARAAYGGEHATAAYWYAFLVRLGGMFALGAGPVGTLAYLAAELALAPYVIARVLATPPAGPAPAALQAVPERDPALAWRSP